jgi:hypothetical protein
VTSLNDVTRTWAARGGAFALAVAVAALLAVVHLGPACADQSEPPHIQFGEITFDFGTMYQHEQVTHAFVFRNTGGSQLEIERVRSTCGCTAAMPEKTSLAPGESGRINITFSSGSMRNRITKHIHVDSNDPDQARVTLTITGLIKTEVIVIPQGIYIGRLEVGEVFTTDIDIVAIDVEKFKILGVTTSHPALAVAKPQLVPGGTRHRYRLTVTFGPTREPGKVVAHVLVHTDLPHSKEIAIPVYGTVVGPEE